MRRNSSIKIKTGLCCLCSPDKGMQPLIAGKCNYHYWLNSKLKSAAKQQDKEVKSEPGLPELIEEADILFSRYIRLKAANGKDKYDCYICQVPTKVSEGQNMHFIKREHLYLRHDERNCRAGCRNCNEFKGGNYLMYVKRLEAQQPGITGILMEESRIPYKPTRDELRGLISELTQKIKLLK